MMSMNLALALLAGLFVFGGVVALVLGITTIATGTAT